MEGCGNLPPPDGTCLQPPPGSGAKGQERSVRVRPGIPAGRQEEQSNVSYQFREVALPFCSWVKLRYSPCNNVIHATITVLTGLCLALSVSTTISLLSHAPPPPPPPTHTDRYLRFVGLPPQKIPGSATVANVFPEVRSIITPMPYLQYANLHGLISTETVLKFSWSML